jgi:hypothetical protein
MFHSSVIPAVCQVKLIKVPQLWPTLKLEYNIKMNFKEVCKELNWIHLAQDRVRCLVYLNTSINFRLPPKIFKFRTKYVTISVSKRNVFLGVSWAVRPFTERQCWERRGLGETWEQDNKRHLDGPQISIWQDEEIRMLQRSLRKFSEQPASSLPVLHLSCCLPHLPGAIEPNVFPSYSLYSV